MNISTYLLVMNGLSQNIRFVRRPRRHQGNASETCDALGVTIMQLYMRIWIFSEVRCLGHHLGDRATPWASPLRMCDALGVTPT